MSSHDTKTTGELLEKSDFNGITIKKVGQDS